MRKRLMKQQNEERREFTYEETGIATKEITLAEQHFFFSNLLYSEICMYLHMRFQDLCMYENAHRSTHLKTNKEAGLA